MDQKQFDTVTDKMDKMTKLLAVLVMKGIEKEHEKIDLLDTLGFRPVEIARMLNKSPENVSVVLSNIRKKKTLTTGKTVQQDPVIPLGSTQQ